MIDAGGLEHDTIGEDMELCVRLHRRCRERKQPYRIVFLPDPVCWTEVPESRRILGSQRNRWQRGLIQVLRYHRTMIVQPALRRVGLFALPYYVLFEALGPMIEVSGYLVTAGAIYFGLIDWRYAELMFLLSIVYGDAHLAGRGGARGDVLPPLSTGAGPAAADRARDRRELRLPPAHHVVAPERHLRLPAAARAAGAR